jgi:hypothetical protein
MDHGGCAAEDGWQDVLVRDDGLTPEMAAELEEMKAQSRQWVASVTPEELDELRADNALHRAARSAELTAEESEEVEAWVTVTVAEAFVAEDSEVRFDSSEEAEARRAEFARSLKAARLDEQFDAS